MTKGRDIGDAHLSSAGLYEKYVLVNGKPPTMIDFNREFFQFMDRAQKEGKALMFLSKRSGRIR